MIAIMERGMTTAKVFMTGRSQAIRLPKEFRFKGREVGIRRLGDLVLLYPLGKEFDIMKASLGKFTPDFMADRNQPKRADRRKW